MVVKVPAALHDGGCDKDRGAGSSVSNNISGGSGQVLMWLSIYMQSSITSTSTEQHVYTHHHLHHD